MNDQQNNLGEDIKPIGEIGERKDVPAITPVPPTLQGASQAPPQSGGGPVSIEALAAEPLPGDETKEQRSPAEPVPVEGEKKPEVSATEPKLETSVPDKKIELKPETKPNTPPVAPPPPPGYRPPEAPTVPSPGPSIEPIRAPKIPLPPTGGAAVIKRTGGRLQAVITIVISTILVLGAAFYFFFYRATLTINPSPAADKITLDGREIAPGRYKVLPGDHTLVVSKTGYITLDLTRHLSINQKVDLSGLQLKKSLAGELITKGATRDSISADTKLVNYVSPEGQLQNVPVSAQNGAYPASALSVGLYPTVRELIFSQDNSFAFILDGQALKVLDFKKTNLVDQKEALLPPDASRISSFSTNAVKSDAFGEANSQIVYDLKTDNDWFLYLADRDHKQAQILMQIDPASFSSMSLDWGQNPRQILLLGGSAAIYDIPTRDYQTISDETGFISGSWGPQAKYAVALKGDGELYVLKDGILQDQNVKAKNRAFSWISQSEVVALSNQGAYKINFDTGQTINYAEIAGLQSSSFIAVSGSSIFFCDTEGLKVAPLKENAYDL